jgi:prepilin-type N-terminal cleavage/methylation domain-containing protein
MTPRVDRQGLRGLAERVRATRRRSHARGFTLIELMVAMLAGIFVAMAAFLLARNASTFFQNEARVTTAQFANLLGMGRLKSDIRRAGFLASPNVVDDPLLCGDPSGWPKGMKEFAALRIDAAGSKILHPGDHALSSANGLSPDAMIIGGTFATTEYFTIQSLVPGGGGGFTVTLQNDGAMHRTVLAAQDKLQALQAIFVAGRFLRVVDNEGRYSFGIINGVSLQGGLARIALATKPAIPVNSTSAHCGCDDMCVGGMVNPVSRVRYDLRRIDPAKFPRYAPLFNKALTAGSYHKGEKVAARTELVRVELDAGGTELPDTLEIVAEYAVDLKFGITTATVPGPPNQAPKIERYPVGSAKGYAVVKSLQSGGSPERVRSVQVRFSTRSEARDRDVGIPKATDGGVFRYGLGKNLGFARVRTLTADVHLSNLGGVNW